MKDSTQEIAEKMAALCDLARRVQESWDLPTDDPRRKDFPSHLGQLADFLDDIGAPRGLIKRSTLPPSPAGASALNRPENLPPVEVTHAVMMAQSAAIKAAAAETPCPECGGEGVGLECATCLGSGKPKTAPARGWKVRFEDGTSLSAKISVGGVCIGDDAQRTVVEDLARAFGGTVVEVEVDENGKEVKP